MDRERSRLRDVERNWRRLGLCTGEGEDWRDEVMMKIEVVDGDGKSIKKSCGTGKNVSNIESPKKVH